MLARALGFTRDEISQMITIMSEKDAMHDKECSTGLLSAKPYFDLRSDSASKDLISDWKKAFLARNWVSWNQRAPVEHLCTWERNQTKWVKHNYVNSAWLNMKIHFGIKGQKPSDLIRYIMDHCPEDDPQTVQTIILTTYQTWLTRTLVKFNTPLDQISDPLRVSMRSLFQHSSQDKMW